MPFGAQILPLDKRNCVAVRPITRRCRLTIFVLLRFPGRSGDLRFSVVEQLVRKPVARRDQLLEALPAPDIEKIDEPVHEGVGGMADGVPVQVGNAVFFLSKTGNASVAPRLVWQMTSSTRLRTPRRTSAVPSNTNTCACSGLPSRRRPTPPLTTPSKPAMEWAHTSSLPTKLSTELRTCSVNRRCL